MFPGVFCASKIESCWLGFCLPLTFHAGHPDLTAARNSGPILHSIYVIFWFLSRHAQDKELSIRSFHVCAVCNSCASSLEKWLKEQECVWHQGPWILCPPPHGPLSNQEQLLTTELEGASEFFWAPITFPMGKENFWPLDTLRGTKLIPKSGFCLLGDGLFPVSFLVCDYIWRKLALWDNWFHLCLFSIFCLLPRSEVRDRLLNAFGQRPVQNCRLKE